MQGQKLSLSALQPNQQAQQLIELRASVTNNMEIDTSGNLIFNNKVSLSAQGIKYDGGQYKISLNDLQVQEEIGRGQFGVVQKVTHLPTGVTMAMKRVRLEVSVEASRQILMELKVLHQSHSPYIIDFYGAFFVEGCVFQCIEFMDAGSLEKLYGCGISSETVLAYISFNVVRGLYFLKETMGVIHRDVKPTNILLNKCGMVKLCDFGVSGQLVQSLAKTHIGSQSYMSPERIVMADAQYSVSSDVWSLGMTIWECAEGHYPFPASEYDSVFAQLNAIVNAQPPPMSEKCSKDTQSFVAVCLAREPKERPLYAQLLQHPFLKNIADLLTTKEDEVMASVLKWLNKK